MQIGIMAVLTEVGDLLLQEIFMPAAVGIMTGDAVLFNRRVLPDKWPPFFSVTAVAELVNVVFHQHLWQKGAMAVVTVTAFNFAFTDGVMRDFVCGQAERTVASIADDQLINLWASAMDDMTIDTSNIVAAVTAHIP